MRQMKSLVRVTGLALLVLSFPAFSSGRIDPETVTFQSEGITLHGLLYKPAGSATVSSSVVQPRQRTRHAQQ